MIFSQNRRDGGRNVRLLQGTRTRDEHEAEAASRGASRICRGIFCRHRAAHHRAHPAQLRLRPQDILRLSLPPRALLPGQAAAGHHPLRPRKTDNCESRELSRVPRTVHLRRQRVLQRRTRQGTQDLDGAHIFQVLLQPRPPRLGCGGEDLPPQAPRQGDHPPRRQGDRTHTRSRRGRHGHERPPAQDPARHQRTRRSDPRSPARHRHKSERARGAECARYRL